MANDRSSEGKTFTGWVVNSGDVTLDDSSASPTSFTMGDKAVSITAQYSTNSTPTPNPGGGSSSGGGGGGGGGGAAVLIGVGAAAAITAGVIMMSPVEIKGRVVLADHTALPGAKISLLREGKVVAQTTADENGSTPARKPVNSASPPSRGIGWSWTRRDSPGMSIAPILQANFRTAGVASRHTAAAASSASSTRTRSRRARAGSIPFRLSFFRVPPRSAAVPEIY